MRRVDAKARRTRRIWVPSDGNGDGRHRWAAATGVLAATATGVSRTTRARLCRTGGAVVAADVLQPTHLQATGKDVAPTPDLAQSRIRPSRANLTRKWSSVG